MVDRFKAAMAALLGVLTGLWGWLGWLVVGWAACMVLDYITGSAAACKDGAWSSGAAKEGIWHKAGMIVVVLVAAGADLLIAAVLENLPLVALPFQYSWGASPKTPYRWEPRCRVGWLSCWPLARAPWTPPGRPSAGRIRKSEIQPPRRFGCLRGGCFVCGKFPDVWDFGGQVREKSSHW